MLAKVLLHNRNRWQTVGASVGIFTGMFLLLFALQVYIDVQVLVKGARDDNFLVINKQFEKHIGKPKEFNSEEVLEIKAQPFFDRVDVFTSNRFQVMLSSEQMGFQTLIFFQSVPNEFLGVDTTDFIWEKGKKLPLILSRDYLALYNYGFAPSQGLPPFPASTISMVDFKVTVRGRGREETFDGYVCGFTPNINSILVPPEFMSYCNSTYGGRQEAILPTQIMASTNNPYSVGLEQFFQEKGYEISRGGLIGGELKSTLYMLVFALLIVGVIIIGLALLVFILNFQVLVAQASKDIQLLLQLGYKTSSIASVLANNLIRLFGLIGLIVFAVLIPTKFLISQSINGQGYNLSLWLHPFVLIIGIVFACLFIWINILSIKRNVASLV